MGVFDPVVLKMKPGETIYGTERLSGYKYLELSKRLGWWHIWLFTERALGGYNFSVWKGETIDWKWCEKLYHIKGYIEKRMLKVQGVENCHL